MSFILDALKKSETDRQEQGSAEFASVPSGDDSPGVPRWLWVLGFLLAINLVVLIGLVLRNDTPDVLPANPAAQAADSAISSTGNDGSSFAEQLDEVRDRQPVIAPVRETQSTPASEVPPEEPATSPPAPVTPVAASAPTYTLKVLPTVDVYSDSPADRFVFINMVRHQENSRLAEGPVVREITPEGVILDYSGTEFLLPRE
jgi:general secretion pathway protein B